MLLVAIGVVAVFGGIAIAAATWTAQRLDSSVDRIPSAFPTGARPVAESGMTFLVVGRDPGQRAGESVAGSIMLLHVTGSRTDAQVVSLPIYAQIEAGGPTLDQTFGTGGPPQLIDALEELTGVRVDHYAEMDYAGFETMADALGGVTVDIPEPYRNAEFDFPAGRQHFAGDAALAYVRDAGVDSEVSSTARQEVMVAALFDRLTQLGLLKDLGKLTGTMNSVAHALRIDDTLSGPELVQLAWSLRNVSEPAFLTAPVTGTSMLDGHPVAVLDPARGGALWRHLGGDTLTEHVAEFR
jgi:LCP family protein required for cell wall assembly